MYSTTHADRRGVTPTPARYGDDEYPPVPTRGPSTFHVQGRGMVLKIQRQGLGLAIG